MVAYPSHRIVIFLVGSGALTCPLSSRLVRRAGLRHGVRSTLWRLFRWLGRRWPNVLSLAGPFALLSIIALWTVTLTLGWALVLWPHLTDEFLLSSGMTRADNRGFLDAVYLSLVTLVTLGYGDITPESDWLRIVAPLEALVSLALITAAISWILSIYPVLARRRYLARGVFLLQRAERETGIATDSLDPEGLGAILFDITQRVVNLRNDLVQFPITYYFHTSDRGSAIELALPELVELARTVCRRPDAPAARLHAALLLEALDDLASQIGEAFLDRERASLDELLATYAADHEHPIEGDARAQDVADAYHAKGWRRTED